jgi:hypothetical protein
MEHYMCEFFQSLAPNEIFGGLLLLFFVGYFLVAGSIERSMKKSKNRRF